MRRAGIRSRIDWRAAAGSLAEQIPQSALHPKSVRWSIGRTRAARGPWTLAFSGGADSLMLLLLVWAHWPGHRRDLLVLHFNHALRGSASDEDAAFCRQVCRSLGVAFRSARWKNRSNTSASEADARKARFEFFDRAMRPEGRRALWLGHQQNDIAESVLMRLARGSGLNGLLSPRPVQSLANTRIHVRPLLCLSKEKILAHLAKTGIAWREDASNQLGTHLRNRVRHGVVPAWQASDPTRDLLAGVAQARELLEEDAEALDRWAEQTRLRTHRSLDLGTLQRLPRGIIRRVLQKWRLRLGPRCGDISRQTFEALLESVIKGRPTRISLGRGGFAVIRDSCLRYESIETAPKTPRRSASSSFFHIARKPGPSN